MNHFEYYKKQAMTAGLSDTERVGRYASQQDDETHIFDDVVSKLPALTQQKTTIIDIGCGCSDPVKRLIANANAYQQQLVLVDSEEMLARLPEQNNITKVACQFPDRAFVEQYQGKADAIIVYSVFQYPFLQHNFISFTDNLVALLAPLGHLLIADLPNLTKKKRFLSSQSGIEFHQQWTGDNSKPDVNWNQLEAQGLDDSVITMLLLRYRQMGFETYLLPQQSGLPFSHTREDLLIVRR
ncbi:class I SAM-dependent methyltransferase [Thalassotalea euphylliae]|uniref:Class I SAM-dependent methyltransferase n=1 Tax=Thalassotalea euphylliae TaxID=1655234 RepID=A0A3E0TPQ5_9GAMM|nr:class I SAM-dependent methyltransferase [Thalassotalea euphylliae]REL26042.1 class I SAM-dependent methyltransferase [Thalassotalea euphylliae]